jgi:nicotinate-nucleotide adenylyltransferase
MTRGLLGGTFDPPHYGHLVLAEEARRRYSLDEVLFVPTRIPPHKQAAGLTGYEHRRRMAELAVAGNDRFRVADLEPEDRISFTVDLIDRFSEPGERPVFIMGMDSLVEMRTWKDPGRLLDMARVVVGTRPGFDGDDVDERLREGVEVFPIPGLWISSTDLRDRFANGRNTRYLTSDDVRTYVIREGLYGAGKGR